MGDSPNMFGMVDPHLAPDGLRRCLARAKQQCARRPIEFEARGEAERTAPASDSVG